MHRLVFFGMIVATLSFAAVTTPAFATTTNPELLPLNLPRITNAPAVPVANWTFMGCWARYQASTCLLCS